MKEFYRTKFSATSSNVYNSTSIQVKPLTSFCDLKFILPGDIFVIVYCSLDFESPSFADFG